MKTGYKIFIISNVIGVLLSAMSIKLPSIIEEFWGAVVLIGLLHAFFIDKSAPKSPPKTYEPPAPHREKTWFEKETEYRWYEEQKKKNPGWWS